MNFSILKAANKYLYSRVKEKKISEPEQKNYLPDQLRFDITAEQIDLMNILNKVNWNNL